MKCFKYQLKQNEDGSMVGCASALPPDSLTGIYINNEYYGAADIDDLTILAEWNAVEISIQEFNQKCTPAPTEECPNPVSPLIDFVRKVRAKHYPPMADYVDGIVKGDAAQVQKYKDDCLAVKAKFPKE